MEVMREYRVHDLMKFDYSEIGQYIDEHHTDKPLGNDEIVDLLNSLSEENEQLKQRNKKMLKVMFALKNYVENEDYERINNAVEKIREEILND